MTFTCLKMLDNAACASQHLPLIDDPIIREAVLRAVKQFLELNWACTSQNLIDHIHETLENEAYR